MLEEIFARKKELRKVVENLVRSLSHREVSEQSDIVQKKLKALEEYQNAQNVSVYVSMPHEISTDGIIKDLLARGVKTFVPQFKQRSKEMRMLKLNGIDDYLSLPEFIWGIRQPPFDSPREDAIDVGIDLMIIPGVAFTPGGDRLGHGGGYYDSYLHRYKNKHGKLPFVVALALDRQIVDEVPLTESDVQVDLVLCKKQ